MNVAVVSVNMGKGPTQKKAFQRAFDSEEEWANKTVELLRANGFNGTGAWCDDEQLKEAKNRVNYCVNWKFMSTFAKGLTKRGSGHVDFPSDCIRVFDPGWERFCERHARTQLAEVKNDPHLLGHFFDNELPLKPGMIERYLDLPKDDAGYQAAQKFMVSRKGKGATLGDLKDADRDAFDDLVIEKYMGTIARAIRKVDPHHMLLGPRLYSRNASMDVIGKYVDAFAYNLYGKWSPASKAVELAEAIGKPLIVTEFYAKGLDAEGLSNESGAGWCVPTQEDRGLFYQNFVLDLLETKVCVGWHWFRYQDNDPGNTKVDASNLNANKGIVNNDYETYEPLVSKMKELNSHVYSLIDYFDDSQ
ncbi:agarase [Novipirellula aureliae]|nr:agarase [Novipirellula aureliae]